VSDREDCPICGMVAYVKQTGDVEGALCVALSNDVSVVLLAPACDEHLATFRVRALHAESIMFPDGEEPS
jgi:hypothetical protein